MTKPVPNKVLIIQTAFIGDVVLATCLIEAIREEYPKCEIHFLLRKGNEALLKDNPKVDRVLVLDKKNKFRSIRQLIGLNRKEKYDYIFNAQRFFVSGLITILSGAKHTVGFNKNPLSFFFNEVKIHRISKDDVGNHEVYRDLQLLESIAPSAKSKPRLYPSEADFNLVKTHQPYVCLAPASVWFTKQLPQSKWIELIDNIPNEYVIFLLGGPGDKVLCEEIKSKTTTNNVMSKAGELSFMQSAALMKGATMNYVNDSGPMHFASAVNAPVTAFFCSTVPAFGFGPLSDRSIVLESPHKLNCRPCGLHGFKACPQGHFKCADITMIEAIKPL